MKINLYLDLSLPLLILVLLSGCYGDKGNYRYEEINEVSIGEQGFEEKRILRADVDSLLITPEIRSTLSDPTSYTYEWVAVSRNRHPGKRTILGTRRDLRILLKLPADTYTLLLKVRDKSTGIVYSRGGELEVRGIYSTGWLILGETSEGIARLDMLSISSDTLHLSDILKAGLVHRSPTRIWVDNSTDGYSPWVYLCTSGDTYLYERNELQDAQPLTLYEPSLMTYTNRVSVTDIGRIRHKRAILITRSPSGVHRCYITAHMDEGEMGIPCNYYYDYSSAKYTLFDIGPEAALNHTGEEVSAGAINSFILFNESAKEFCYTHAMRNVMVPLADNGSDDPFRWDTKKDFPPHGLEQVRAINSSFAKGQSAFIMRDSVTDTCYLYTFTITRQGGFAPKGGRYPLLGGAAEIARSSGICLSARQGHLIYALNSPGGVLLKGYTFRSGQGTSPVTLATLPGEEVTLLYADTESPDRGSDSFYLCTWSMGAGGVIRKYSVADDPDRITLIASTVWTGFPKVVSMCYKSF